VASHSLGQVIAELKTVEKNKLHPTQNGVGRPGVVSTETKWRGQQTAIF